ncbi:MAG: hypothetical protein AB7S44_00945 [Spirochaetales bacterium]
MNLKKALLIIPMLLLSASGLMFGCTTAYDRMQLDVSTDEVVLYLDYTLPQNLGDNVEGDDIAVVAATISNVSDKISTDVTFNTSSSGIISVEQLSAANGTTTLQVKALRTGTTNLIIRSEEGDKEKTVSVSVIQRIEAISANSSYNFAVEVGTSANINTTQALSFLPANTNQKGITYTIFGTPSGVTVSEAGLITVTEKSVDNITVLATSISDPTLSVTFPVKIIEPILASDITLTTQELLDARDAWLASLSEPPTEEYDYSLSSFVLANNMLNFDSGEILVEVTAYENYNVIFSVSNTSIAEATKLESNKCLVESLALGTGNFTVRVEVVGYESFYAEKTIPFSIVNFATDVTVDNQTADRDMIIFDNYSNNMGAPLTVAATPSTSYSKAVLIRVPVYFMNRIALRYSDGTLISLTEDDSNTYGEALLPRGMTIYVMALQISSDLDPVVQEFENTIPLSFVANSEFGTEPEVSTTITLQLTVGAIDVVVPDGLSIEKTNMVQVIFGVSPSDAYDSNMTITASTLGIVDIASASSTAPIYNITGLNEGTTTLTITTANGISRELTIVVYVALIDAYLNMESPAQNYNVAVEDPIAVPGSYTSVQNAVVAIGAGINLYVTKSPSNASVTAIYYSSSNRNVATITSNGYIVITGIGLSTITVTINSRAYLTDEISQIVSITKTFVIEGYIPINSISLNTIQLDLYDSNSLGFYDLGMSTANLELSINPINATFNMEDLVWQSSSPYLTVNGDGLVQATIPTDVVVSGVITASITVGITEYSRYYSQTCVVRIHTAIKVKSITVYNVSDGYIYLDSRDGVENVAPRQLSVQTYPYTATNADVDYLYIQDPTDTNLDPVFSVSATGLITPLRAGIASLRVVARDSYISATSYALYNEIVIKVADGLSEATALEIKSSADLLAIDTVAELDLHYVLASNIDLTNSGFTSIGKIGTEVYAFNGSLNGRFEYGEIVRECTIRGYTISNGQSGTTLYTGLVAINNGALKNLNLTITSFNTSGSNNSAGTLAYFGGLVGINYGTIENTTVKVLSSQVQLAARTSYVGIVVAENSGYITDCVASGVLNVKEVSGVINYPLTYVGGLAGINTDDGIIEGSYIPTNTTIGEGEVLIPAFSNALYQKEGMNSIATINSSLLNNTSNGTGLIAGKNLGTISNVATDGEVSGLNNIGGLVGININTIENSYSSSLVVGVNNVGGLIGLATSETVNSELVNPIITSNAVEIYDRQALTVSADVYVTGVNNVGGLIGFANDLGELDYNYVNTYYLRTLGSNYSGDIVLNMTDSNIDFAVGGLIGRLGDTSINLTKNYANANIVANISSTTANNPTVYGGGLIGIISENFIIDNSYTKGSVNLPATHSVAGGLVGYNTNSTGSFVDYTYSVNSLTALTTGAIIGSADDVTLTNNNYAVWDLSESEIWYYDSEMSFNDGLPVLYSNAGNLLLNEAPSAITVTIKEQSVSVTNGVASFNHLKVGDNEAVVILSAGTVDIRSLIDTDPSVSRFYVSSSNENIVKVLDDGSLQLIAEGTVTITISSLLNVNIYDTFELAVIKGFTSFSLSDSQDASEGELDGDLLEVKKDDSLILYNSFTNSTYTVSTKTGIAYTATSNNFTINGATLTSHIVEETTYWDTDINGNSIHVLTGTSASDGNVSVTATPYIIVKFGGVDTKVYLEDLAKSFYVNVYVGATSITTDVASAILGLREELTLNVYVITDKLGDELNLSGSELEDGNIFDFVEFTLINGPEATGNTNEYVYTYRINATEEYLSANPGDSNFKTAKEGQITFVAKSNTSISTNFDITLTPQDLLRIDITHYPAGEMQIVNGLPTYYPKELPSNIIAPGQPGILKLNLYPEYADVDYYEIVSSVASNGQFISFEQVMLIDNGIDGIYYTRVTPSPELILHGTTLSLISTNGDVIYDGTLYVKTLIASNVPEGTVFEVTVTGYRVDEYGNATANLSKTIELIAENLPGVTILYNGARTGQVARGTTVPISIFATDDYDGIIDVTSTVDTNDNEDYNSSHQIITVDNEVLRRATVYQDESGLWWLDVGAAIPSGSTITLLAEVSKTVNGIIETSQSQIELTVVDFVINSISVRRTTTSGTSNIMSMYVGASFKLEILLDTEQLTEYDTTWNLHLNSTEQANMQTIVDNINASVLTTKTTLARNIHTWYERKATNPVQDVSLQVDSYTNFSIYEGDIIEDADYPNQELYIRAKKISTSTNIVAQAEFYYDSEGHVQIVDYDSSGTMKKYPEVITDPTNSTVDIYKEVKLLQYVFSLDIVSNSTLDKPVPVYNVTELMNMQAGVDYILLNEEDIILENWVPLDTAINSLDGNGRTIYIKSFAADETSGTYNFGLFGTISQNTVIKNIKIDIAPLVEEGGVIDATEFTTVNFGFVAGTNNGTITNCDILNSSSTDQTVELQTAVAAYTTFGGLVGINNGGYITNSRVGRTELSFLDSGLVYYPITFNASGIVGGYAGLNTGIITTSYVANITITNTSESENGTKTAGFVATNTANARVSYSYVEGIQTAVTEYSSVITDGGLSSLGNIGGFVYSNSGDITDCYSNLPIETQSRSAGFVYENNLGGTVDNSYSTSKIIENTTSHLPFVGSSNLDEILNNGTIEDCYYLDNNNYLADQFENYPAVAVAETNKKINFTGFTFLDEVNYEDYSVWNIDGGTYNASPRLPATDYVTVSLRDISSTVEDGDTIIEYNYNDVSDYQKGDKENPILVSNAAQFLEAMTWEYYAPGNVNNVNIRLIRDIDFNDVTNNTSLQKLQNITFTGTIDGNGMSLLNVKVLSYADNDEDSDDPSTESFGMFYQIGRDDEDYASNSLEKTVIKNLNIVVSEISATDAISVGVLSGVIKNSVIMNVDISGNSITVQGRNAVGALAGQILGNSRIINISSNVSISSEYRTTDTDIHGDIDYSYYNEYGVGVEDVSYAGGIAGIIDIYVLDKNMERVVIEDEAWVYASPKVSILKVSGNVTIRAEHSGGVAGYIGAQTYAKNLLFEVSYNQSTSASYQIIIGYDIAGGLVAENSGQIDHARVAYSDTYQLNTVDAAQARLAVGSQTLFRNSSNYVGGLVGYNNLGRIINSYSRVDVVNVNAKYAGGLIGVNYAGLISKVYATGHVKAVDSTSGVVGGLIGILLDSSLQYIDDGVRATDDVVTITDAVAANNWQIGAYTYLGHIGAFIGQNDTSNFAITSAYAIDNVYSALGDTALAKAITKVSVGTAITGVTQVAFAEVIDLSSLTATAVYSGFVGGEDVYWTLESEFYNLRYPQLLFSDFESLKSISTPEDFAEMNNHIYGTFKITNDIYLDSNFETIPLFKGTLSGVESGGVYPTIYYLNLSGSDDSLAMFGDLDSANLNNFNIVVGGGVWSGNPNGLVSTSTNDNSYSGIICGMASSTIFSNISIKFANDTVSLRSSSQYFGIIAGWAKNINISDVTINSSAKDIQVITSNTHQSDVYIGGVVGKLEIATITNLQVNMGSMSVNATNNLYTGGLFGTAQAASLDEVNIYMVEEVYVDANENGKYDNGESYTDTNGNSEYDYDLYAYSSKTAYVGGVAGTLDTVTIKSIESYIYVSVPITARASNLSSYSLCVGGVAGDMENGILLNVIVNKPITIGQGSNVYAGGLIGDANGVSITTTTYSNAVGINNIATNANMRLGGLIGKATNVLLDTLFAITDISTNSNSSEAYVGGLIGEIIKDSTSKATNTYGIKYSYYKGDISVFATSKVTAGGLVGQTTNSSSTGSNISIFECYVEGNVTSESGSSGIVYSGGLIGRNGTYESGTSVSGIKVENVFVAGDNYASGGTNQFVGGLIGYTNATVTTAYSVGTVYSTSINNTNVGPSIGARSAVSVNEVYFDSDLVGLATRANNNGATAKTSSEFLYASSFAGIDDTNIWIKNSGYYPYLKNLTAPNLLSGSILNPARISNSTQFGAMSGHNYYLQTASFSVSSQLATFDGIYNGNGNIITYTKTGVTAAEIAPINTVSEDAMLTRVTVSMTISLGSAGTYDIAGLALLNKGIIYKSYSVGSISTNSYIATNTVVGGLVAENQFLIESCATNVTLNLNVAFSTPATPQTPANLDWTTVGGLVGFMTENSIVNTSFVDGRYDYVANDSSSNFGGLVGYLVKGKILNSYTGILNNSLSGVTVTNLGGLAGAKNAASYNYTISNSHYDAFAANRSGGAGENYTASMAATSFITTLTQNNALSGWTISDSANYGYPYLSFMNANLFDSGNGTASNPYKITHAGRLDWVRTKMSTAAYFEQTKDIDLTLFNTKNGHFDPIGSLTSTSSSKYDVDVQSTFIGIYNGKNYVIDYLQQSISETTTTAFMGLFRALSGEQTNAYGYVYNVNLQHANMYVSSTSDISKLYMGGIAGAVFNGRIVNCSVESNSTSYYLKDARDNSNNAGDKLYIGAIAGYAKDGTIDKCYSDINVYSSFGYLGGIVGYAEDGLEITNVYNNADITIDSDESTNSSSYYVGGIVGFGNNVTINNVKAYGYVAVTAKDDASAVNRGVGGIAGLLYQSSISYAYNEGSVVSAKILGGSNNSNAYNAVGGVIGSSHSMTLMKVLKNSSHVDVDVYGSVSSLSNTTVATGGIVGYVTTDATNSYASYLENAGEITYDSHSSSTSLNAKIGGIFGYMSNNYNLSYSFNGQTVTVVNGTNSNVGGIAGYSGGAILDVYNTAAVTITMNANVTSDVTIGGIVGTTDSNDYIQRSYNTANVNALNFANDTNTYWVGGIAGYNNLTTIRYTYNTGRILFLGNSTGSTSRSAVGGIAGFLNGSIYNSYNRGAIDMYNPTSVDNWDDLSAVGGIAGLGAGDDDNAIVIDHTYNYAQINEGVSDQYICIGKILGTLNTREGGDYIDINISITASYYDSEENAQAIRPPSWLYINQDMDVIGWSAADAGVMLWVFATDWTSYDNKYDKTLSELQTQSTYVDSDDNPWNFSTIWQINSGVNNGLPTLRNLQTSIVIEDGGTVPSFNLASLPALGFVSIPTYTLGAPGGSATLNPNPSDPTNVI